MMSNFYNQKLPRSPPALLPTMKQHVDEFLGCKRSEGCSRKTVYQYNWHLERLFEHLEKQGDTIAKGTIRRYVGDMHDAYAPATVKIAVIAIRGYCEWLVEEGHLPENHAAGLKVPRVPRRLQRTLSADELLVMLDACDDSPKGLRDAAILSLLADSGLRRAELVSLTVKHVDFERQLLYGFRRKGGSYGWASFGAATAGRLHRWLAVRHVAGTDALFVAVGGSTPGSALTGEGLRTIVRKIGDTAGVPGVTPHAFRRSFACLLVEGGAPTRLVQELGGWADVRQVERYTQALDAQRLARQWSPMDAIAKNGKQSPDLPLFAQFPNDE